MARALETRLNRGEFAVELVADLQAAIAQVCAASADWKDADAPASVPEAAVTDSAEDGLAPLFKGLLAALDHNDPDASESWLTRLREKLDDTQWVEVETLLTDFDFRGAKTSVQGLMRKLNLFIAE